MRSNKTGKELKGSDITHSLSVEVFESTLANRCEWYRLLSGIAEDLEQNNGRDKEHIFALFGTIVSLSHRSKKNKSASPN
jgi:hypothetical protein